MFFKPVYRYRQLYSIFVLSTTFFAANAQKKIIPFNNRNILYEGRIAMQKDAAKLSWSGSTVIIYFTSTNISVELKNADTANYYNIIIGDKDIIKLHILEAPATLLF